MDALAARGVRFSEARSNTTWTLPSTASLLSGQYQETHGVVTANDRVPDDLPLFTERFGDAGFDVAFISQMIFASERHGFDRGVDHFVYHGKNKNAPAFHEAVRRRLDELGDQPTLTYVHFRRPHSPYDPSPEFLAPFEADCPLAGGSADKALRFFDASEGLVLSDEEREHLVHLYRGSLREVDRKLGEMVEVLGDRLTQDTLLVVTSDHGEGLGEHGDYGHGEQLHREHVHIPLLMVGPGLEPVVVDQPVSTVDLAPTLYEMVGVDPPAGMEGRSLAGMLSGDAVEREPVRLSGRWYPDSNPQVGVVGARWTVLQQDDGMRVYDRRHDRHEQSPRESAEIQDPELAMLIDMTQNLRKQRPAPKSAPAQQLTAEQIQELKRLGYLK
jgi:arylsulfatase A-like enzyme